LQSEISVRRKLCTIHEQLARAAVLTCTLASAISLNRNRASVFFTEYFRARFKAEVTNTLVWTAMLLPMEYVSWLLAWLQIRTCVLRYLPVECLRLLLFGSWIVILAVADKHVGVKTSVDELRPLGMLCLVLAYSVPWSHHGAIGGVGGLARSLPWGVIITVAGSGAISLVVKKGASLRGAETYCEGRTVCILCWKQRASSGQLLRKRSDLKRIPANDAALESLGASSIEDIVQKSVPGLRHEPAGVAVNCVVQLVFPQQPDAWLGVIDACVGRLLDIGAHRGIRHDRRVVQLTCPLQTLASMMGFNRSRISGIRSVQVDASARNSTEEIVQA
ncbi:hypothetical protein V5799_028160, partial [Amblyomma americanum]